MKRTAEDNLSHTREAVLGYLEDWAKGAPEELVSCPTDPAQMRSRRDILEAVQKDTLYGRKLLKHWHRRAIEHILAAQLVV